MKKKKNEILETGLNLGVASVGLGVAGKVTEGVGGNAAGITAFSSALPIVGTAAGAGLVLKELKKIK